LRRRFSRVERRGRQRQEGRPVFFEQLLLASALSSKRPVKVFGAALVEVRVELFETLPLGDRHEVVLPGVLHHALHHAFLKAGGLRRTR